MKLFIPIGVIGSGKNFYCEHNTDKSIAFADPLLEDVWTMIGWRPKDDKEYQQFKDSSFLPLGKFGEDRSISRFTGRDLLQRYGTEVRRKEDPDVWVKRLTDVLDKHLRKWIGMDIGISDCRFHNEVKGIIAWCEKYGVEYQFVLTNFKSYRYDAKMDHESEYLAQHLLEVHDHPEFEINNYLKNFI